MVEKIKLAAIDGRPELFSSIQGEGKSVGRPSVFVRCSLCNLNCVWCDTDYTWNWVGTRFSHVRDGEPGYRKYDKREQIVELTAGEAAERVAAFGCRNVVLTGGEPLLQQPALVGVMSLLRGMDAGFRFEAETNGTIVPEPEFDRLIAQFNVSPKLSNAGVAKSLACVDEALRFFAGCERATFKFVVSGATDVDEIAELQAAYSIPASRIFLMPEGTDSATLRAESQWIVEACKEREFSFSDRLHVHLYGAKRGV